MLSGGAPSCDAGCLWGSGEGGRQEGGWPVRSVAGGWAAWAAGAREAGVELRPDTALAYGKDFSLNSFLQTLLCFYFLLKFLIGT